MRSRLAAPEMLGRYARSHWGVENKIHYVRDVTFGRGSSRIRSGHGPQNASTLRSVAMNYLRTMGSSIADAKRRIALSNMQPYEVHQRLLEDETREGPSIAIAPASPSTAPIDDEPQGLSHDHA